MVAGGVSPNVVSWWVTVGRRSREGEEKEKSERVSVIVFVCLSVYVIVFVLYMHQYTLMFVFVCGLFKQKDTKGIYCWCVFGSEGGGDQRWLLEAVAGSGGGRMCL